jgi:hypothetical protein
MLPLQVSACLYYVNHSANGVVQWAAGTTNGLTDDAGNPVVSWTAYDNGITWTLPYSNDVSINCTGVRPIYVHYPITETLPPETEPPYDPPVEYPDTEEWVETENQTMVEWYETIPPEVEETLRDAAESLDAEDELNAILEKYGCTSAVGLGSLTALLTVAAAAYALKKK